MDCRYIYWTQEQLHEEALKFTTRQEFREKSPKAESVARQRGVMDSICGHMERGISGFNPELPGYLYYVRFDHVVYGPLYKIGITNKSVKRRFKQEKVSFTTIKTWYFENGREAYEMEQRLHKEHAAFLYTGDKFLYHNGDRELFTRDVLGLDATDLAA
jgi:hypothetical protein